MIETEIGEMTLSATGCACMQYDIYTYVCTCIYTVYTYVHVYIYVCTCIYTVYTYVHVHIHIYIYICIYTSSVHARNTCIWNGFG